MDSDPCGLNGVCTLQLRLLQRTRDAIVARAPLPILSYAELPKASLPFCHKSAFWTSEQDASASVSVANAKTVDLPAAACVTPKMHKFPKGSACAQNRMMGDFAAAIVTTRMILALWRSFVVAPWFGQYVLHFLKQLSWAVWLGKNIKSLQ